ncbi:MAG: DUF2905 domain-containing protein [Chloroflexia bacterium]|nr:DUF2905 domain-containing protein [Chloroflexia bacterium]
MGELPAVGKMLLVAGLGVAAIGACLLVASRIPGVDRLGRLPGDIVVERGPVTIMIPVVSSIVISLVLTLVLNLLLRR